MVVGDFVVVEWRGTPGWVAMVVWEELEMMVEMVVGTAVTDCSLYNADV